MQYIRGVASKSGTSRIMPVYQWIDDLEIWNGLPPVLPPDTTKTE